MAWTQTLILVLVFCLQVTMVIGMVSRCTMGHLQLVVIAHPPCRGWTWHHCPPGNGRGRTGLEQETREREIPAALTEVRGNH